MKRTIMLTAFVIGVLAASGVRARQAKEDPERLQFRQGIELFEAGRFEQAAVAFRRAYELKPAYKVLFNLAQAENNANRFAAALWAYTKYLADGGGEIPRQRAEQVRAEIERLNALVGTVEIRGVPDGAEVLVDRESRGRIPLAEAIFVDLGRHEVVIEHQNRRILERVVTLAGGETVVLDLASAAASDTSVDEGAPIPSVDGASDSPERLWTWVALGAGGAAAVAAGITGGVVLSRAEDIKERCNGDECPPAVEADLEGARTLGTVTDVLWGVAAAGIAAGVVLFFVEPRLGERTPAAAVGFAPLSGGGAVTLGGRF